MSGKSPLELLNIVPMLPEYREELAADTLDLLRRGCINRTAFILTLVPEGNPPADKAAVLGERFEQFRAALGKTDMPVGILIQATIGHGWVPNTPSEFQRIVLPDGERPYMFCPARRSVPRLHRGRGPPPRGAAAGFPDGRRRLPAADRPGRLLLPAAPRTLQPRTGHGLRPGDAGRRSREGCGARGEIRCAAQTVAHRTRRSHPPRRRRDRPGDAVQLLRLQPGYAPRAGDRPDTRRARRTADDPDQQRPLPERIAAHSAGVAHVHRPPDRGLPVRKPAAGRTGHLSAQPLFDQRGHDAPAADLLDPRGVPRRKILAEPERLLGAGKRPALPRHPRPERPFLSGAGRTAGRMDRRSDRPAGNAAAELPARVPERLEPDVEHASPRQNGHPVPLHDLSRRHRHAGRAATATH